MIAIIDYKAGNIRSVENVLKRFGAEYVQMCIRDSFGTKDDLLGAKNGYAPAANLYFSKNSFSNMNQMWRLTQMCIRDK